MSDDHKEPRRTFLKIGPSMIIAAAASPAAAKTTFKRTSPAARSLLEVGLLLGAGGHSNGIWGRFFNTPEGEVRRLGMIYTKVWGADRAHAEAFGKKFGIEVVKQFDSMVDNVDGVMIDDFDAVAYNHRLARPYLEAGMPTFINRPFTDSVR
ncbi:MAG: Rossmann-fold NAD(P)-binding domain-containing protein, partial [Candidatus Latescibacterota bacterium]